MLLALLVQVAVPCLAVFHLDHPRESSTSVCSICVELAALGDGALATVVPDLPLPTVAPVPNPVTACPAPRVAVSLSAPPRGPPAA